MNCWTIVFTQHFSFWISGFHFSHSFLNENEQVSTHCLKNAHGILNENK